MTTEEKQLFDFLKKQADRAHSDLVNHIAKMGNMIYGQKRAVGWLLHFKDEIEDPKLLEKYTTLVYQIAEFFMVKIDRDEHN